VATRAAEALLEVDRIRRYLDASTTVLFAQNGMCRLWPPNGQHYVGLRYGSSSSSSTTTTPATPARPNFGAVVTTHGVTSSGPFASVHASSASVVVGPVLFNDDGDTLLSASPPADPAGLIPLLATPALAGTAVPAWDLWARQLDKLVVNAVINPLTALLRVRNGVLFDRAAADPSGPISALIRLVVFEAWLVLERHVTARALYRLTRAYAAAADETPLAQRFSYDALLARVLAVGAQVRENTSSMLQHVLAGRPTEVREFNGWIVDTAAAVRLRPEDVAVNARIVALVQEGAHLHEDELEPTFDIAAHVERAWGTVVHKVSRVMRGRAEPIARESGGAWAR
jgi:2-dehydropantoate 2-reductase